MAMARSGDTRQQLEPSFAVICIKDFLVVNIVNYQEPFTIRRVFQPFLNKIAHVGICRRRDTELHGNVFQPFFKNIRFCCMNPEDGVRREELLPPIR